MKPFTTIRSRAVWLPDENIDTDVIFPARFLLLLDKAGIGKHLFQDRRHDEHGKPRPDFPLNRDEARDARILVCGDGFGCGSSREHAVWALADRGIECLIAPGFGDIFASNCLKNGVLPVTLPAPLVHELGRRADAGAMFEIDLATRAVRVDGEAVARIGIGERHREALLNGWDEADILLAEEGEAITAFEAAHRAAQPWLFEGKER